MKRQINADELQVLYHDIGSAIWHIQYLEDLLVQYIVMKDFKRNPITEAEAYERLAKARKNVLGKIYQQAKGLGIIPVSLEARFEKFIAERNWLIHRSVHESGSQLYDNALRAAMIKRISVIQEEAMAIKNILYKELISFMTVEKVDMRMVDQLARERLQELVK